MKEIIFRFFVVYLFVVLAIKIAGKRQVGEMQTSELVAAFFISELACYAVTNKKVPLYRGLLPIFLLVLTELIISYLAMRLPFVKKILDFSPSVLIRDGSVLEKELRKNRITLDELLSMLRLNGYYDISKVRFAILEPNGQLSVVPYAKNDSLSPEDLNIQVEEIGFSVAIINDGIINENALKAIGKNQKWLKNILERKKISSEKEVFLLSSDYLGNIKIIKKCH